MMGVVRKLVRLGGELCLAIAGTCWFQYGSIEMSWAGHRPLTPDPSTGNVISINNHGIMYVSQADLDFQHYFVLPGLLFGGAGVVLFLAARIMGEPDQAPPNARLKRAGTIAEVALIAFMPIWLFANPYTALARAITDPRSLLLADVGTGLLWLGCLAMAQHGTIFKGGARRSAV